MIVIEPTTDHGQPHFARGPFFVGGGMIREATPAPERRVDDGAQLLSAEQLAGLLQVSKRTVWRLRSAGKLPRPVQLGGSLRWRSAEIHRWIDAGCPPLKEWEAAEQVSRQHR